MRLVLACAALAAASTASYGLDRSDLGTEPHVRVAWYDPLHAAPVDLRTVGREVAATFRGMGVDLEFTHRDAGQLDVAAADASVVVPVIVLARPPLALASRRVMGLALRGHTRPSPVWIFADQVRATLGIRSPRTRLDKRSAYDLAVALGRVTAHEVIHSLAPEHPHASGGLMAPALARFDLVGPRPAPEASCVRAVLRSLAALPRPGPASVPGPAGLVRTLLP